MAWRTAKDYIKRFNNIWGLPYPETLSGTDIVNKPTNETLWLKTTNIDGDYSYDYGIYLAGKLGFLGEKTDRIGRWEYTSYLDTLPDYTQSLEGDIKAPIKPLTKVYLNCRRLKNVLNTSNILTGYSYGEYNFDVLSQTGIQYSKQDFINQFGEYLIVVNKDGNMMDINYDRPANPQLNKQLQGYSIAQVNRDLSFNVYADIGYTVKFGDYIYPFLNFEHNGKNMTLSNPFYIIESSFVNSGINKVIGWSGETGIDYDNYTYTKYPETLYTSNIEGLDVKQTYHVNNFSMYFEKDRTLNERLFSFANKYSNSSPAFPDPHVNQILIYNKRDLEEYFRAFGVEVEYIWDDLEPFDDWDEQFVVRKVRREALANKEKVLSVNKVRRK